MFLAGEIRNGHHIGLVAAARVHGGGGAGRVGGDVERDESMVIASLVADKGTLFRAVEAEKLRVLVGNHIVQEGIFQNGSEEIGTAQVRTPQIGVSEIHFL